MYVNINYSIHHLKWLVAMTEMLLWQFKTLLPNTMNYPYDHTLDCFQNNSDEAIYFWSLLMYLPLIFLSSTSVWESGLAMLWWWQLFEESLQQGAMGGKRVVEPFSVSHNVHLCLGALIFEDTMNDWEDWVDFWEDLGTDLGLDFVRKQGFCYAHLLTKLMLPKAGWCAVHTTSAGALGCWVNEFFRRGYPAGNTGKD